MTNDWQRIERLAKEVGISLEERQRSFADIMGFRKIGFSLNENERVTGLNLDGLELSAPGLKTISTFLHLEKLSLRNNQITDISFLQGLNHLIILDLYENQISDISSLKGLNQLTTLNLGENRITDISSLQGLRLSHLKELFLSRNQVTDISFLQGLSNLTELYLGDNEIKGISSLHELIHLTSLDLAGNQITDISALQKLSNLTALDLGGNQITDISALSKLTRLQYVCLCGNRIRQLPAAMAELGADIDVDSQFVFTDEKKIYIAANPLEKPPIEIIRKGKSAMRDYFQSLAGKQQSLNEVKVLLVGDGGAGKTSLVKRLLQKGFDQNEDQTHGINIKSWTVNQGGNSIKVNIWDFGGQEIMHATHQFFLSKRSLYILVLDGRKDEKTEYWLKHIESLGGNSPILVVLNKIDQHPGFDVNRIFLQAKYKNIKEFFRLSCSDERGIKEFTAFLAQELANVEMIRTTWPTTWFNIKEQLEHLSQHYIDYEQYRLMCEKEKIPETTKQETLLEFLNDLGVALHFKEFDLQDTHVLQPRWVTSAVYKIINSAELAESRGVLQLEQLKNILKKEKESDYRYPREKYRYIMGLMQKFELCYVIDDRLCLIPDLLPVQEPKLDMDNASALKFILQYNFLPRSIMPRFIVNMHKDIKDCLQWRTGVVLEDKDFHSIAVVKADYEARRIYIHVTGEQRREYFAVLLAVLRRIHRSFETLKIQELIPMPDDPDNTVKYKQLLQFEKQGILSYYTGEPGKVYKVYDLLGTITSRQETDAVILEQLKKMKEILLNLENEKNTRESLLKATADIIEFKIKTPIGDINPIKLVEKLLPKSKKPKSTP